jgi:hypothetical protein
MRLALFRLTSGLYYLLAGLWLGILVAFALAAPQVFFRVRAFAPQLTRTPADTSPKKGADGQILAGDIVTHILAMLDPVQIVCATGLAGILLLQCTVFRRSLAKPVTSAANWVRVLLLGLAIGALVLQLGLFSPTMATLRERLYHPDTPAQQRGDLRQRFEWYHTASERTLGSAAVLLAGGIVISPFVLSGIATPANPSNKETRPDG